MRLITGISIATLAVSVAALALVLWLVVREPWEPDAQPATPVVQSANEEHTRELDAEMVRVLIGSHVSQLIESEGLSVDDDHEEFERIPGYRCFWDRERTSMPGVVPTTYRKSPEVLYWENAAIVTYKYIEKEDVWLVTSVRSACKNNYETWTIDDNTGAITYGRLP